MARLAQTRPALIGPLLVLGVVLSLLYLGNSVDLLSGLTRPLVTTGLQVVGVEASADETHLMAGQLRIPWTGDCAGLNILAILVAVTFWSQRGRPLDMGFWVRLLAAFPLAFVANLLRIFSLIGLRWLIYPAVESPQLHYFIGFVWVLPFLVLLLRRPAHTPLTYFWLEIFRLAAVLSLLAPFISAPGGLVVAVSTLFLLARHTWRNPSGWWEILLYGAWILGGAVIGIARMESLWIPWLLTCPGFLQWNWSRMVSLGLLLPGTIPLVGMNWWSWLLVIPGVLWEGRQLLRPVSGENPPSLSLPLWGVVIFFHMFPFLAGMGAALSGVGRFPPPQGVMTFETPEKFFVVRQVGQPADLHCFWYEPGEGGRHHTVGVCLQYRGVSVGQTPAPGVYDDGVNWLTEFFIMPGGGLLDYRGYLQATFWPFSTNGAHLIYAAPKEEMSAEEFLELARSNARNLAELVRSTP